MFSLEWSSRISVCYTSFLFFFWLPIMFSVRVWGCGFSERCEMWVRESESTEESQDIRDSLLWWDGAKHPALLLSVSAVTRTSSGETFRTEGERKHHDTHDCFCIHAEDVSVQSQLPYTRDALGKVLQLDSFTKICFLVLFCCSCCCIYFILLIYLYFTHCVCFYNLNHFLLIHFV